MKYLDILLNGSDHKEEIEKEYLIIKQRFNDKGIEFNEEEEMMFSNHLICLIKRVLENNFIADIDEELMSEISATIFVLTEECIGDLFTSHGCDINKSELFLVATHIQVNLNRKESEK